MPLLPDYSAPLRDYPTSAIVGISDKMSTNPTPSVPAVPSEQEVVEVILELAAEAQDKPVDELREAFAAAGSGMAIDSLETVEILLGLEERFSVRLPDDAETCAAFRSVGALVERVRRAADALNRNGGSDGG